MLVRSYSEKESQLKLRTKQPSEKDILFNKVQSVFQKGTSISNFKSLLAKYNIQSYERGGKLTGVIYGKRRYRFKQSLGIDIGQFQVKDKVNEREKILRTLRDKKGKSRKQEREC